MILACIYLRYYNSAANFVSYLTNFIIIIIIISGGETESTWYCGHYWPIVPAPDDGDCGVIGGIEIGRGNRSTQRKPAPAPLCPPQIPHDQAWART
jgi:hypothetical protein